MIFMMAINPSYPGVKHSSLSIMNYYANTTNTTTTTNTTNTANTTNTTSSFLFTTQKVSLLSAVQWLSVSVKCLKSRYVL